MHRQQPVSVQHPLVMGDREDIVGDPPGGRAPVMARAAGRPSALVGRSKVDADAHDAPDLGIPNGAAGFQLLVRHVGQATERVRPRSRLGEQD